MGICVLPINKGVGQGSDIESTLFIHMVSDLQTISNNNKIVKYGDDVTLLKTELSDVKLRILECPAMGT